MDLERRMTIANTMNKMGPGIIGSSRSEAYVRAMYAASAERTSSPSINCLEFGY
ncbi:hypothetical protein D8B26_007006 [Coccidioides posadasii str. Silveira]|uniref:uncharacterized protein n=1 Tax=Coccidioides posadasii (strain RMSCC 757 / Silveira) TaxID=443226 RepID=UPI001BEE5E96|nr:hypothetical protein D8B26_007006 [Coccidioides posadasii str. Silveira]